MSTIKSIVSAGPGGLLVDIECHLSNSLPNIVIVGLGGKAVEESKERMRSAFAASKIPLPRKRIILNLAPADIPKDSTCLDVAMAASILTAHGVAKRHFTNGEALIGELGLDGNIRPIRGIIGKLLAGKKAGISIFWIPTGNMEQAQLVPGITLYSLTTLSDMFAYMVSGDATPQPHPSGVAIRHKSTTQDPFSHIHGQQRAKRALLIAAAGGHNVFMHGPPGTGKTMLAKAFAALLPPLSQDEILEVSHLHSLGGDSYEKIVLERPLRAPHHGASHASMIGGGAQAKPGEVTLSHCGVLFLDEMLEFERITLESLRQPLEDRLVTIARSRHTVTYPANFILVETANPCPCGYFGSDTHECICSHRQLLSYRQKLSGPLLDRIDLRVAIEPIDHANLFIANNDVNINRRRHVLQAREIQERRQGTGRLNALLTNEEIIALGHISNTAHKLLVVAAERLQLSARSYVRAAKIARTIADLDGSEMIESNHISEALQYRSLPSQQ